MKASNGYAKLPGATAPGSPSHIGCKEYLMTVSSRLYFSSFYRLVYFFMIASSLVCVVWVSRFDSSCCTATDCSQPATLTASLSSTGALTYSCGVLCDGRPA